MADTPKIDFSNADAFKGVIADPSSLPPAPIPVAGAPLPPQLSPEQATRARLQSQAAQAQSDLEAYHAAHPETQQAPAGTAEPQAPSIPPLPIHNAAPAAHGVVPAAPAAPAVTPPVDPTAPLKTSSAKVSLAEEEHGKAIATTGEQEAANATAESEARTRAAQDLKVQQQLQELDRTEAAKRVDEARQKAASKKFTGLFEGEYGAVRRILGAFGQILGSVSYDANHVNQSTKIIDDAIKQNFEQQQAEKADLWKDVQNTIEQKQLLRADQLQEMGNFQAHQAAAIDAVIAKGKSLAALSKNKEGIKAIEANNARLEFERDQKIDESNRLHIAANEKKRMDDSQIALNRAHASQAYAAAAHSKAQAGATATAAGDLKNDKLIKTILDPDEKNAMGSEKSPGPLKRLVKARAISADIQSAVDSRDPEKIKAAIASAREQASNILTGNAATNVSTHLVTELQGKLSAAEAKISSFIGSPTEGKQFVGAIQKLVHGIEEQNVEQARTFKKQALAKAATTNAWKHPELRSAIEGRIEGIYSPLEEAGAAPELPAGWRDSGKKSGGKTVYVDPAGGYHVAQ